MSQRGSKTAIAAWLLILSIDASGGYFKCQDEHGNTVFSDTACNTVEREEVTPPVPSSSPAAGYRSPSPQEQLQAQVRAKEQAEYEDKRARLLRELNGITVSPKQSISAMMENKRRRSALEREIELLDRGYLAKRDPAAAQRLMEERRVQELEDKVKRLERKAKRDAAPVTFQRYGDTIYDSNGGIWQRHGNTIHGPNGQVCQQFGNTIACP